MGGKLLLNTTIEDINNLDVYLPQATNNGGTPSNKLLGHWNLKTKDRYNKHEVIK